MKILKRTSNWLRYPLCNVEDFGGSTLFVSNLIAFSLLVFALWREFLIPVIVGEMLILVVGIIVYKRLVSNSFNDDNYAYDSLYCNNKAFIVFCICTFIISIVLLFFTNFTIAIILFLQTILTPVISSYSIELYNPTINVYKPSRMLSNKLKQLYNIIFLYVPIGHKISYIYMIVVLILCAFKFYIVIPIMLLYYMAIPIIVAYVQDEFID